MRLRKLAGVVGLTAALSGTFSSTEAQTGQQVLRGILEAARQGQGGNSPQAIPSPSSAPVAKPVVPVPSPGTWPSRQAFISAVGAGQLINYDGTYGTQEQFASAIYFILSNEYLVPPIPRDCYGYFVSQSTQLFSALSQAYGSGLDDQPPNFITPGFNPAASKELIQRQIQTLKGDRTGHTMCETVSGGVPTPHPYQAALIQLATEYDAATRAFVIAEQRRRKEAYQTSVSQQQQEQQQRQAAGRQAEQERINREAARIRADEQRRVAKEKARVGG